MAGPAGGLLEVRVEARPDAPGARAWSLSSRGGAETVLLDPDVALDQSQIATADVEVGPDGSAQIRLQCTPAGAAKLLEITASHVGGRLGIVLDGQLRAAPRILAPVANGVLVVAGTFTATEAAEWARKLGPPAPAKVARPAANWLSGGAAAAALAPLQGSWSGLSATMEGRLRAEPKLTRSTWTFRGDELTLTTEDGQTARFSLRVESGSSNGFWLEPLPPSKESGWALFSRNGDRLTLAFGDNLEQRPDGFAPAPRKIVLKLARQGSVPAVVPCDILEAAGVARLLPGATRDAKKEGRAEGPACVLKDPRGQEVALMVAPAAGKAAYDKAVEEARKASRPIVRDEPELGPTAVSWSVDYLLRFFVLKRETFVLLSFETSVDARQLKEFAKRVLARVPDIP
jgi:uncharacterized protein (TIGR03067 family)